MTYIESEGLFAVVDDSQKKKLLLFDQTGAYKGTRPIQYLSPDYVPSHFEGMAYIPPSSSTFPDHLIMVVSDSAPFRLEVVRRDGVVVSEIYRSDWPSTLTDPFVGDVAYLAPNRLLITTYDSSIWTLDFSGNVLSGPLPFPSANGFEGIVQMKDGRIVAVGYPQNLFFFDRNLTRLPASDRADVIGLNLLNPSGVAWNSDTDQFLITSGFFPTTAITAVPTSLDTANPVVDAPEYRFKQQLTYLAAEHLIAVVSAGSPRAIVLFNTNGTFNSEIALSPGALGFDPGSPLGITYIPTTDEFLIGFNGNPVDPISAQQAEKRRLRVFSRAGAFVREIDLTPTGTESVAALTYFEDAGGGGGRLMILGSAGRILITDLDGHSLKSNGRLFGEFNGRAKLDMVTRAAIAAITTGPLAGSFAMVDRRGGEIVIFRLD